MGQYSVVVARLLLLLALAVTHSQGTDYCATSSKCGDAMNIGCRNNGAWSPSCPSDKKLLTFTAANKNTLVRLHNEHRNYVAGGRVSHLKAACRMATIKWNDELAYLASLNVRQCAMKHDACHNTDSFKFSGQNLAWMSWFKPLNVTEMLISSVNMWYKEVSNTKQSYINAYPKGNNIPSIGHFTVMVADRNIEMGCAATTYSVGGKSYKAFLLACNYATTNIIGVQTYSSCSTAAKDCKTGTNSIYKNLCSTSEKYSVNTFK